MSIYRKLLQYARIMRLNKPIGILLLLWPTLWALWLASARLPDLKILFIFVAGVILMRSAGCVMNDCLDRNLDGHVTRTKQRPLVEGSIQLLPAIILTLFLCLLAFALVLMCNALTIKLAVIALILAMIYPLLKRVTHLPQLGLGVAFSWGVPMAFAAVKGEITLSGWFLFLTAAIWTVIYDTMYAMVDREDDVKVGIKSTAILFNDMDKLLIGLLQTLFIVCLIIVGLMFSLHFIYYMSIALVILLCAYQQWLIKDRDVNNCFSAFLNNNWVGLVIFLGIFFHYWRR